MLATPNIYFLFPVLRMDSRTCCYIVSLPEGGKMSKTETILDHTADSVLVTTGRTVTWLSHMDITGQ